MRLDLAEIVRCLGCARDVKVTDGSVTVTSVVTDSREAVAGSLFVCIAGERVETHVILQPELIVRGSTAARK